MRAIAIVLLLTATAAAQPQPPPAPQPAAVDPDLRRELDELRARQRWLEQRLNAAGHARVFFHARPLDGPLLK